MPPVARMLIRPGDNGLVYREVTSRSEAHFILTRTVRKSASVTSGSKSKPFHFDSVIHAEPGEKDQDYDRLMRTFFRGEGLGLDPLPLGEDFTRPYPLASHPDCIAAVKTDLHAQL